MAAICLGLMAVSAHGGSLDAPAAPTNAASAMWTLNDIYNVLDTRTTNVTLRTGGFTEPTGGPTNGTMHTLNDIMTLVTNRAPVAKTGQTNTYAVGDDGTNRIGVAWPNPRFSPVATNGEATNQIRDNLTGLIWAQNANLASNINLGAWSSVKGTCTWARAFDVITNSAGPVNGTNSSPTGYGGTNDWRLPNVEELYSLIAWQYINPALSDGTGTNKWTPALGPFANVQLDYYFSSTPVTSSSNLVWSVLMSFGFVFSDSKTSRPCYVWPVRGGQ